MKCSKCGAELSENDVFCPKCGTQQVQNNEVNNTQKVSSKQPAKKVAVNQPSNGGNNTQNTGNRQQVNQQKNNGGSGSTAKAVIITILIIAILAAAGYGIYTVVDKIKGNGNGNEDSNKNTVATNSDNNTNSTNNTNTLGRTNTTPSTSTYKVSYKGFKFYIPDNLVYEMNTKNNTLMIGDALSTWAAQMSVQKIPFQQIKQNRNTLVTSFTEYYSSYGATISNPTVETIDGVEFVLMEATIAGTKEIMAMAQLNSMYTACFDVVNHNNDFDKSILKNLTSIIKTAEFTGDANNMETPNSIKPEELNKILQKATESNTTESNTTSNNSSTNDGNTNSTN